MNRSFRCLLYFFLLISTINSLSLSAKAPVTGVSSIFENRIVELERTTNAYSQLLIQLQQQLSDNQSDIDSLRNQIQENQYQLHQVIERQKQISFKIDNLNNKIKVILKNTSE